MLAGTFLKSGNRYSRTLLMMVKGDTAMKSMLMLVVAVLVTGCTRSPSDDRYIDYGQVHVERVRVQPCNPFHADELMDWTADLDSRAHHDRNAKGAGALHVERGCRVVLDPVANMQRIVTGLRECAFTSVYRLEGYFSSWLSSAREATSFDPSTQKTRIGVSFSHFCQRGTNLTNKKYQLFKIRGHYG